MAFTAFISSADTKAPPVKLPVHFLIDVLPLHADEQPGQGVIPTNKLPELRQGLIQAQNKKRHACLAFVKIYTPLFELIKKAQHDGAELCYYEH